MKDVPIPLVLDLWSLGHSAGDIAARVGLPNGKHVTRIVAHARELGDKRAVLHYAKNGRLIGRPGRAGKKVRQGAKTIGGKEAVQRIAKVICVKGHPLLDNRTKSGGCRTCERIHGGWKGYKA